MQPPRQPGGGDGRRRLLRFLASRWVLILNLALLVLIGWAFLGEYRRGQSLLAEIDALNARAVRLSAERAASTAQGERMQDNEMLEREARLKLGLRKPGEEVVVVRGVGDGTVAASDASGQESEGIGSNTTHSVAANAAAWLAYFIK